MSEYVIEVKDAVKRFKETCALDHVSLNFETGKIYTALSDATVPAKRCCLSAFAG